MIVIEGKNGIKATVLADSINKQGNRFITFEIEYPRLVLAELNTHKMLSRNSFSSRAVPFTKMIDQLIGMPVRFGANQAGMQDKGEDYDVQVEGEPEDGYCFGDPTNYYSNVEAWGLAKEDAIKWGKRFYEAGYHKQVYNRLLEPFQMMKTVISATEWANFFWLRDHKDADPTLAELARCMREAAEQSTPELLKAGDWHLPYLDWEWDAGIESARKQIFYVDSTSNESISLEDAIKISCARCAAVSYRNEGYGLEKSIEIYDKLVGPDRKHASAFEHQATPIRPYGFYKGEYLEDVRYNHPWIPYTWEEGITHVDRKGRLWSGNLCGFIQYRKLIPGENYEG